MMVQLQAQALDKTQNETKTEFNDTGLIRVASMTTTLLGFHVIDVYIRSSSWWMFVACRYVVDLVALYTLCSARYGKFRKENETRI